MSIVETPRKMTAEELLAMPDDGVERWLIRGELRENQRADFRLNTPDHCSAMTSVVAFLAAWIRCQLEPRGAIYCGNALFSLRESNTTVVGIDVAYVSAERRASTPRGSKIIEGVPVLAVEILSPSDLHSDISEKIQEYLDTGVMLVWVVDPDFETVTAFTKDYEPRLFSRGQELQAEPQLPGFKARVAELFE
jgi:Uma2 family endonuclease